MRTHNMSEHNLDLPIAVSLADLLKQISKRAQVSSGIAGRNARVRVILDEKRFRAARNRISKELPDVHECMRSKANSDRLVVPLQCMLYAIVGRFRAQS